MKITISIRFALLALVQAFFLVACDASSEDATQTVIKSGQVQNDPLVSSRSVVVTLEPQQDYRYVPSFNGRVILAEPVTTVAANMAKGDIEVDGVNVVYVGESCEQLLQRYPQLENCQEEGTAEFRYQEIETTALTDDDGYATLSLGNAEKYRLRVTSFATDEDDKCFWGGQKTIGITETTVTVPMLIFCE